MSEEYLEALNGLFDLVHCQDSFEKAQKYFDIIEEALHRLESIDNAEPSEALECLELIGGVYLLWGHETVADGFKEEFNIIKQALLKAQEPKQYLKWEDLEFKEETSRIEVKLNETLYTLSYVKRQYLDFVYLINNDSQIRLNSANDKQFFNNLHLERVEENE